MVDQPGTLEQSDATHDGSDTLASLVLDLLEWVGPGARPYDEVMDAWRTSCPRLPVWEEATRRGYLARVAAPGRGAQVVVSPAGRVHLRRRRSATST